MPYLKWLKSTYLQKDDNLHHCTFFSETIQQLRFPNSIMNKVPHSSMLQLWGHTEDKNSYDKESAFNQISCISQ